MLMSLLNRLLSRTCFGPADRRYVFSGTSISDFFQPRAAILLIAATCVACGRVPPITDADLLPTDLQSVPTWAPEMAGRPIGAALGARPVSDCFGFIDIASAVSGSEQTRLEGWAWNTADETPFEVLIVTDRDGLITGAGVTVVDRADVGSAFPKIVSQERVGFVAFSTTHAGGLTVHGVDEANSSTCAIGSTG